MSYDFGATGSEPVEMTCRVTFIDQEAIDRFFGAPDPISYRVRDMTSGRVCPVCGEVTEDVLVEDVTITPTDRPNTYQIHGKSLTYSPCGHQVRQETYDKPAGASE